MGIIIGRAIEGISLNGLEYLMNEENTSPKVFGNKKLAIDFLITQGGCDGWSDDDIEDNFIFEESDGD